MIRNKIFFGSTDSQLNNTLPQYKGGSVLKHMQAANCGIVCCKGHTHDADCIDQCSKAVCPMCTANLVHVTISPPPKYSCPQPVTQSQQLEFDVDLPFYKGIIPRAPHLQDSEIGFDMDATYYNGAPLSQKYRTKTRAHIDSKHCCIV